MKINLQNHLGFTTYVPEAQRKAVEITLMSAMITVLGGRGSVMMTVVEVFSLNLVISVFFWW